MLEKANCKINLGLNIIGKRDDGYHDIETAFYPVNLSDIIEITQAEETSFQMTGGEAYENLRFEKSADNLCMRAYNLVKEEYSLPNVKIHLHKEIPVGAGLGGGSSDCAFTIKILNKMFSLNLSTEKMEEMAGKLGSDCAFFIRNKPVFAKGRGEIFEKTDINLKDYTIVIVKPEVNISTGEAYNKLRITNYGLLIKKRKSIKEIINLPVGEWKDLLVNDFEEGLFEKHYVLKEIKEKLYYTGAAYASMSGSGSAVYGIFDRKPDMELFKKYSFVWKGKMV